MHATGGSSPFKRICDFDTGTGWTRLGSKTARNASHVLEVSRHCESSHGLPNADQISATQTQQLNISQQLPNLLLLLGGKTSKYWLIGHVLFP
jgi:hypothetical protein